MLVDGSTRLLRCAALAVSLLGVVQTPTPLAHAQRGEAGPFSVWHGVPDCRKADPAASLEDCLGATPRDAHIDRAMLHLWFRDFDGAMHAATAGLPSLPSPAGHLLVGRLVLTQAQHQGRAELLAVARAHLEQGLATEPGNADVLATLGFIDEATGDWPRALIRYDLAAASMPSSAFPVMRRAYLLAHMDKADAALLDAERALALGSPEPQVQSLRAALLSKLDRHGEAVSAYDRVIELVGPTLEAVEGRARAYTAIGRLNAAVADLSTLIDGPATGMAFALAGEPLAQLRRWRGALRLQLGNGAGAAEDYLEAARSGGVGHVLTLQLTLKRLGWPVEIDGNITDDLRRAVVGCLANQRCRPAITTPA